MIRFMLILALASCSTTAKEPPPREPVPLEQEVEREPEVVPKQKHERVKPETAHTPQPLPPLCNMETEDERQEMLNKLDCLLKTVK